jgi:hypothetical protein
VVALVATLIDGQGQTQKPPLSDGRSRTHCMPVGHVGLMFVSQSKKQRPTAVSQIAFGVPEVARGQSAVRVHGGRHVPFAPASGKVHWVFPRHAGCAPHDS